MLNIFGNVTEKFKRVHAEELVQRKQHKKDFSKRYGLTNSNQ